MMLTSRNEITDGKSKLVKTSIRTSSGMSFMERELLFMFELSGETSCTPDFMDGQVCSRLRGERERMWGMKGPS